MLISKKRILLLIPLVKISATAHSKQNNSDGSIITVKIVPLAAMVLVKYRPASSIERLNDAMLLEIDNSNSSVNSEKLYGYCVNDDLVTSSMSIPHTIILV